MTASSPTIDPPKTAGLQYFVRWTFRTIAVVAFVIVFAIGFGTSSDDQARLSTFTNSVEQWQKNTEFRQVAMQYVTRGSDAMRSRPMGMRAADWIVAIRSLPLMPKGFALNDTSRAHYENFSRGPLSAYLHLCTEVELFGKKVDGSIDPQGGYLPELEGLFGKSAGWSYAELHHYLAKQQWDYPVVQDAGAVESVRSVLVDSDVSRGYPVRAMHIDGLLRPHIQSLATELKIVDSVGVAKTPEQMDPQEQYAVFDRLDAYVKRTDPQLWRTKQVSDFVGGIWGQVFSPPYTMLLGPWSWAVPICRWVTLAWMALVILLYRGQAKRTRSLIKIGKYDRDLTPNAA